MRQYLQCIFLNAGNKMKTIVSKKRAQIYHTLSKKRETTFTF